MHVSPGDFVTAGQEVAQLDIPSIRMRVANARKDFSELEAQHTQTVNAAQADKELHLQSFARQAESLRNTIHSLEQQHSYLSTQLGNQKELLEQGLITRSVLSHTEVESSRILLRIEDSQNQIKDLDLQREQL